MENRRRSLAFIGSEGSTSSSLFNRRRTLADIFIRPKSTSSQTIRPNSDEALSWSNSIQTLLQSKYGISLFRAFLKSEVCEETLEFYEAIEKYKAKSSNIRKLPKRARKILMTFIIPHSPKEINLDEVTRSDLIKSLEDITRAHAHSFDHVQSKILNVMTTGSYVRFLKWSHYLDLTHPPVGDEDDPSSPEEHDSS